MGEDASVIPTTFDAKSLTFIVNICAEIFKPPKILDIEREMRNEKWETHPTAQVRIKLPRPFGRGTYRTK
jgi:hypothetical protein